jgi:hypothetical protein
MHAFVRALIISGASLVALVPLGTNAQELVLDTQSIMKARVVEVISEEAKKHTRHTDSCKTPDHQGVRS